jgi:hypothetical protein
VDGKTASCALHEKGTYRMPTTMPARYSCLVVFSVLMVLGGCGVPCQRCGKEGHVAPTTPSRAVQELLAHRTWAAFVEGRAAHEERAMQVAAIEADHDRVAHLPRVSLRVGTPIPLATAMQMLVAETGYSVVYEVGVDPQHPVSSLLGKR